MFFTKIEIGMHDECALIKFNEWITVPWNSLQVNECFATYKPETNAFLIRLCLIKYFSVNVKQLFSTQRLGTFFVYDSLVIRFLVHI